MNLGPKERCQWRRNSGYCHDACEGAGGKRKGGREGGREVKSELLQSVVDGVCIHLHEIHVQCITTCLALYTWIQTGSSVGRALA